MKLLKFIIIALLFSCSENEPRYAVKHNKKSIENPSILKSIISEQNQKIDNYLSKILITTILIQKEVFGIIIKKKMIPMINHQNLVIV